MESCCPACACLSPACGRCRFPHPIPVAELMHQPRSPRAVAERDAKRQRVAPPAATPHLLPAPGQTPGVEPGAGEAAAAQQVPEVMPVTPLVRAPAVQLTAAAQPAPCHVPAGQHVAAAQPAPGQVAAAQPGAGQLQTDVAAAKLRSFHEEGIGVELAEGPSLPKFERVRRGWGCNLPVGQYTGTVRRVAIP